jgi:hypothetical protein
VAHATYRTYKPEHLIELSKRAEACCIYDHMVAEAGRRFDQRADVRPIELRGLKLWVFGDHTVARFKKMDEDGISRNYPTKQAEAFDRNQQLDGIPPEPTRVTVGYWPDPTGTAVLRVQVARPNGRKRVDWCAAIVPATERIAGTKIWEDVTKQAKFGT